MPSLPAGFVLRALTADDLPAVQALMDACESADTGERCVHIQDIAADVHGPHFDLERGTWVIVAPDGRLAAAGWANRPEDDGTVAADHYVRPDLRGMAFDEVFLDLIEERAAAFARETSETGGMRLVTFCEPLLATRRDLTAARGFVVVREIYQMRLDLAKPAAAAFPAGISLRRAHPGEDDHARHAASEEAFSAHFLYSPTPFDEWQRWAVQHAGFDPELWLVAWDGDEIAGQVWALPRGREVFIQDLSVRKRWRGRGIGLALLLEAFRLLATRGYPFVRLYMDAQNATGALDLYLRAGMRVERRFEVFAKALGAHGG
jgi:ribosomal protein S18 acetylase RimI-like enzyme